MHKRTFALMAAVAAFAVAGCGGDDEEPAGGTGTNGGNGEPAAEVEQYPADSTLGQIQQRGELKVGVKFDVPPFGFRNPQTNDVEGFDVDLGKAVAERLGVKFTPVEAISDNRIPFLEQGTVDLVLSTMTINAERAEQIEFSEPYYVARGRILVREGSDIQGVDDLAGRSVCTALGSTYEATLKEQAPDAELRLVDSYSECLELIQNESVDAVSTDDVILTGMIIQDDSLTLVGDELTTEPYGAGIKKGETEMVELVNDVLSEYKSGGGWSEAYQKWIGQYTNEEQEPPTMTLDEAIEATS
jgi:ABC-type amino acid transport substrate-binding protein